MSGVPIVARAEQFAENLAIVDASGEYSYQDLLNASEAVAAGLLDGRADLDEARIAFLVPSGFDYVAAQWGIWRAGGIATPLCVVHPLPEMQYVLDDTAAEKVIYHQSFADKLAPLIEEDPERFISCENIRSDANIVLPGIDSSRRAMILYTSGSTGKPKGVVSTHANIASQITSLIEAWRWTSSDHILHVLPLHHTHGIINVLCCALWSGAACEMLEKFDAAEVWHRFVNRPLTLFMAVPTIYVRLINEWEAADPTQQARYSDACRKMRLMVSGSAALPVTVFKKWESISGHILLERYGMTEIGMALSNPYDGERRPGHVGQPLPGVTAVLFDEDGNEINAEKESGEIRIKGDSVFLEYWQKQEATEHSFRDGWFLTGDMALIEDGYFRIIGRSSVDIIKTGGYKVSALEIEEILRTHESVKECAVVGVPDDEWGERVCVAIVATEGANLELKPLRDWCKERMAIYKVPSRLQLMAELPRNVMGKVTKPAVKELFTNAG